MKIETLMENTACSPELAAEHGLSLYIEANGKRILFDAGQSGAFADNAKKMGIDLQQVDFVVLSHGHCDHGDGLIRFLECNNTAPVYVSPDAFGGYYNAHGKYIGLDRKLQNHPQLISQEETVLLAPGITLVSGKNWHPEIPLDHAGLQKEQEGKLVPDDFAHEQYLVIEENGKRVVFSGCSHRGIVNIVRQLPCDVLVGGFHFMKQDPVGSTVQSAMERLLEGSTVYYTCHCTGQPQYAAMKEKMGSRLHYLSAGTVVEL